MLTVYLLQKNTDIEMIATLEADKKLKLIDQAENPKEAFWNINRMQPDAVIIDLDDAAEECIELAKHLNQLKTPPLLIFLSKDDAYAPQAIGLGAVDYLVKPLSKQRLHQSADILVHYYNQTYSKNTSTEKKSYKRMRARNKYTDKFLIKLKESIIVINTDEIVYIGTENRKVFVKTLEGKYVVDTPLYILERRLGPSFVRIHRSFIINIYYLVEIQPWFNDTYSLIFKDGSTTPVSRSYVKSFRKTLGF